MLKQRISSVDETRDVMRKDPDRGGVKRQVNEYVAHLEEIARVFTKHAREVGLGVRLDARGA